MKKLMMIIVLLAAVQKQHAFGFADTTILRTHLKAITKTSKFRTYNNVDQLDKTAQYIRSVFAKYSSKVTGQKFNANGRPYKNIIASFGPDEAARIIIGAHYDVCGNQQGADDNASGVTGLLELARLLKDQELKHRIDLVAYSLEEPPFFRTEQMGSYVHANSLADAKVHIYGMISLEMIGYFVDKRNSQAYPPGVPSELYGDKGDFITLVTKLDANEFEKKFCSIFEATRMIKTNRFAGPPSMPGIDFSDHVNYWKFGFDAMMISDTSFYRNKGYHSVNDTMETLDLERMAKVIDGIFKTLIVL